MERTNLPSIDHRALMSSARQTLSGQWGMAVGATLVYFVILMASGIIPFSSLLITGPFSLGLAIFALNIAKNNNPQIGNIFDGFQQFGTSLGAYLLMLLGIVIGMLLFIIPGIILGFGLSQTYFIIAKNRNIGAVDALKKSWELMKGRKLDYFILTLRFLPWILLSIFTLFIGLLWVIPYMQVTMAKYHEAITASDEDEDFMNIEDHLVAD